MKKTFSTLLAVCLLFPAVLSAQLSVKYADTLNKTFEKKAVQYNLKSAAAAVVFPDGSVWEKAHGNCGTTPTSSNMLFEMGSNTKTFTASLILQLANEGKLALNDTIYKYLPVYPNIAHGITIRQLLNHTSGVYSYTDNADFADYVNNNPTEVISPDSVLKKWIKPMNFAPGTKWEYSNTGYMLLGKIIEKITGVPYHEALRKNLLDKFGFKEIFFDVYESYSLDKAGNWLSNGSYWGDDFTSFMSAAWSAGAILATPRDLAKWARALYTKNILPGSWLDSMRKTVTINSAYKYGLGMFQRTYKGNTYLGHGGTTLQWSEMEYSLRSGFSCVVTINEQNQAGTSGLVQNALIDVLEKVLPLGIETTSPKVSLPCYPNPATDNFLIQLPDNYLIDPSSNLKIYSVSGELVRTIKFNNRSIPVSRDNLPDGIYFLILADETGNRVVKSKVVFR